MPLHEPGRPKGVTISSPRQRPGDGVSFVASALKGRANRWAEWLGPFRAEWDFLGWGFPRALPWAGFGEGRWPADTDLTHPGGRSQLLGRREGESSLPAKGFPQSSIVRFRTARVLACSSINASVSRRTPSAGKLAMRNVSFQSKSISPINWGSKTGINEPLPSRLCRRERRSWR